MLTLNSDLRTAKTVNLSVVEVEEVVSRVTLSYRRSRATLNCTPVLGVNSEKWGYDVCGVQMYGCYAGELTGVKSGRV